MTNPSNHSNVIKFIKDLTGQSNVLTIPRAFIKITGDIKAALFLSQCIYWSDKTDRKDGYFYKDYADWEDETGLTRKELDAARKKTTQFVKTKLLKANGAPTLHYSVDMEGLYQYVEEHYEEFQEPRIAKKQRTAKRKSKPDLPEMDNSDLYKRDKSDLPERDKSICTKQTKPLTETTTESTQEITLTPPGVSEIFQTPPIPENKPLPTNRPLTAFDVFAGGKSEKTTTIEDQQKASTRAALERGLQAHQNRDFTENELHKLGDRYYSLGRAFAESFGRGPFGWEVSRWIKEIKQQLDLELTPDLIKRAYKKGIADQLTLTAPGSVTKIAEGLKVLDEQEKRERERAKELEYADSPEVYGLRD